MLFKLMWPPSFLNSTACLRFLFIGVGFIFMSYCVLIGSVFADATTTIKSVGESGINESKPIGYNAALDPKVGCDSWALWCDIKFGIKKAESVGVNGLMINGYAYHPSEGFHVPTGYANANELAFGAGYTKTFYNPQYNSEYSLYVMGLMDSFYKPEIHAGYVYQQYFDLNDSGTLKWGIGYTPFVFIKPSLTNDAPIPIPAAGLVTSIKYHNVDIMLTYFNILFLNARVDF